MTGTCHIFELSSSPLGKKCEQRSILALSLFILSLFFLKTGHMRVISPPKTLPDHLLTFNLTWQGDGGLEDKVLCWRRGRREGDEKSRRICSRISSLFGCLRGWVLGSRTPVLWKAGFLDCLAGVCGSLYSWSNLIYGFPHRWALLSLSP